MASWSVGVSLRGKDGLSVLAGNGAPSPILGDVGQPGYIDVQNNRLYGPKTAQGWPTTYVNLQATLPNNLQANSIILAPVQGETLATQITLKNSSGTSVFAVDVAGAVTALSAALSTLTTSGAATVGGTLGVTGLASAGRFIANNPGSASAPMLAYTANGSGSPYTCGWYTDSIKSEIYEMVADRVARSVTFVGTTPANSDRTFITHNFYSGVATGSPSYRFYVAGGGLALQILGSADATFYGQLAINGLATAAGLKLSSGVVTFADGTTQSTAGGAAPTPATYAATSAGTVASPAFRLSTATNGAGLYFDGAQGNTLLSVNGYKSLYSTSAANAAAGASGWVIASTLGAGSALLALFGSASTTVPVASIDGAGALAVASAIVSGLTRSAGVTLTSGAVTFADGTTQTTASAATPATFAATNTGTAVSPAFRYGPANNGAGLYFDGAQGNTLVSVNGFKSLYSTSAANAASGANGWAIASTLGTGSPLLALFGAASTTVPVASIDGAGALLAGTATFSGLTKTAGLTLTSGSVTFADGTTQTTAGGSGGSSQAQYVATSAGTAAAPAFTSTNNSNTGIYFTGSGSTQALAVAVNGANAAIFSAAGALTTVGAVTAPNVTLAGSGGKVTYADGTTQTTAPLNFLTSQSVGFGPVAAYTATVSTTPVLAVYPGSTITVPFVPSYGTAFMGMSYINYNSTVTLTLLDQTTGGTIWSGTATGNFNGQFGQFSVTQYPMPANHTYVWQITAASSSTANIGISPQYLSPAVTPTYNVSSAGTLGLINKAFSGTPTNMNIGASTVVQAVKYNKATSLYSLTINNQSSAAVTFLIYVAGQNGAYASFSAAANSITNLGPYNATQYTFAANTQNYYAITGSVTGTVFVDMQVLSSIA